MERGAVESSTEMLVPYMKADDLIHRVSKPTLAGKNLKSATSRANPSLSSVPVCPNHQHSPTNV